MEHTSSFDIKTANDFYEKMLVPQYADFIKENSSSRHALLATILAYHMFEWVHGKKFGSCTEEEFQTLYPTHMQMYSTLEVAGHLTNGTKHFRSKPTKTRTQTGFSSAFSSGFARPLNIELSDGSEVSADAFLERLLGFWKEQKEVGAF